jgi:hypothetical protein
MSPGKSFVNVPATAARKTTVSQEEAEEIELLYVRKRAELPMKKAA